MLKKIITLFCLLSSHNFTAKGVETDQITIEWLYNNEGADYIPHMRRLFNKMKVRTLIQAGCNYSTKYFLEKCDKVITIEFLSPGTSDKYFIESLKLFKKSKNWLPLAFNADLKNESFNKACAYQCATHKNYALIDPQYVFDLDAYFKKQVESVQKKGSVVDVVFVKTHGIYLRGDMVNLFLWRSIPVVIASDTNSDEGPGATKGLYGWFKIYTPPEYVKIYFPFGSGTTFWIKKTYPELIDAMNRYLQFFTTMQLDGYNINDIEVLKILADSP